MATRLSVEDGTFGVPLETLLEKYPAKIDMGSGPNPKTVPFVVAESIRAMNTMGNSTSL